MIQIHAIKSSSSPREPFWVAWHFKTCLNGGETGIDLKAQTYSLLLMEEILHQWIGRQYIPLFTRFYSGAGFLPSTECPFLNQLHSVAIFGGCTSGQLQFVKNLGQGFHRQNVFWSSGGCWCRVEWNGLEMVCSLRWVFPKIGVPQIGWFIIENPIKLDDLGYHYFRNPPDEVMRRWNFPKCPELSLGIFFHHQKNLPAGSTATPFTHCWRCIFFWVQKGGQLIIREEWPVRNGNLL